jgi:capsular polysaccharide biosynthesis protein
MHFLNLMEMGYIIQKIIETVNKVPKIEVKANGCYISRQDTIKRGWYHKRNLVNELELIDRIQNELGYDIIELMDYDMIGKIQVFKSYKNIIHQSSASNVNVLFSNNENTNILISHPRLENWLNFKCQQFSQKSKTNLITLDGGGEIVEQVGDDYLDKNNTQWELVNLDGLIDILKQIDKGEI